MGFVYFLEKKNEPGSSHAVCSSVQQDLALILHVCLRRITSPFTMPRRNGRKQTGRAWWHGFAALEGKLHRLLQGYPRQESLSGNTTCACASTAVRSTHTGDCLCRNSSSYKIMFCSRLNCSCYAHLRLSVRLRPKQAEFVFLERAWVQPAVLLKTVRARNFRQAEGGIQQPARI